VALPDGTDAGALCFHIAEPCSAYRSLGICIAQMTAAARLYRSNPGTRHGVIVLDGKVWCPHHAGAI